MIPHSRPLFGADSERAVSAVVHGGHTARGPASETLEKRVAALVGRSCAAAVDSGTSALMLALFALSTDRPVRRVGIPAYACRSLLHAVRACDAEPVSMDCTTDLRLNGARAETLAPTLDAVILNHPFGMIEPLVTEDWPCPVIEDMAQAAGGKIGEHDIGGFGDVSIASFYATKPWGGAYGGMVLSNQAHIVEQVCLMRDVDAADVSLPYAGNHQLSDVHAALAICRLDSAAAEMIKRCALAARYDDYLQGKDIEVVRREASGNCYRYIVRVENAAQVIKAFRAHGVVAAHPVAMPLSRLMGQACPGAELAQQQCVSLPLLADMTDAEEDQMRKAMAVCL